MFSKTFLYGGKDYKKSIKIKFNMTSIKVIKFNMIKFKKTIS